MQVSASPDTKQSTSSGATFKERLTYLCLIWAGVCICSQVATRKPEPILELAETPPRGFGT